MDKVQFTQVLQVALWYFEGCNRLQIVEMLSSQGIAIDKRILEAGVKLAEYLKYFPYPTEKNMEVK